MNQSPAVLFDLGNVLVSIHPEAFLRTLGFDTEENRERYQLSVNEIVRDYERGEESTERYLDRLFTLFDGRFERDRLRSAMLAVIGRPVEGMEEIVARVARRARVALLSNTNPLHYEHCMTTLPTLRHISLHFLSYRLRALKPEPLIFERVLRELGVDSTGVRFIDDVQENVAAARRAGIDAIRFIDVPTLKSQLRDWQLL